MRVHLQVLSVSITLLLSSLVLAQPSKASDVQKMAKDDCAKARAANKTCVLTIDSSDEFEGNVPQNTGDRFDAIGFGKAGSLIKIRRDFIQEIIKSAEDL